jgi:hypothetical protein
MKAIATTYKGPTGTRRSRIIASDGDGNRITYPHRSADSSVENHAAACKALCEKMDWHGVVVGGHARDGMVWVFSGNGGSSPTMRV